MIRSISSIVTILALLLSMAIGFGIGWFVYAPDKTPEPPPQQGVSIKTFEDLFPKPAQFPVIDRRFYTIEKVTVDSIEVPVPAKLREQPFRLLYQDGISVRNDEVSMRLWNPFKGRYEGEVYEVPEPRFWSDIEVEFYHGFQQTKRNTGIAATTLFGYKNLSLFARLRYETITQEAGFVGIRYSF